MKAEPKQIVVDPHFKLGLTCPVCNESIEGSAHIEITLGAPTYDPKSRSKVTMSSSSRIVGIQLSHDCTPEANEITRILSAVAAAAEVVPDEQ